MKVKKLAASKEKSYVPRFKRRKNQLRHWIPWYMYMYVSHNFIYVTLLSCTRNNNFAHRSQTIKSNKDFIV